MKLVVGILLALAACDCQPSKIAIHEPPPVPIGDAGDPCANACATIRAFGCGEGEAGLCEDACRRDQAQGVGAQLSPGCVVGARSVDALRACGVECP